MTKPADERTAKLQERAMQWTEDFANCDPTLRKQFAEFAAAFAESEIESLQRKVVCSFCGTAPRSTYRGRAT